MSNSISLMLSMIFLAFFIILSGEIISYQKDSSRCLSYTNQMAIMVQKGYDSMDIINSDDFDFIDYIYIDKKDGENYDTYTIKTIKKHSSFSKLFNYFNSQIVNEIVVCRKE